MTFGIDYAFSPHPPVAAMKTAGVKFVCRYTSAMTLNDTNGKNLLPAEKDKLLAAGLDIVIVAEEAANRMLSGKGAGIADAAHANAVVKALGMPSIPVYFACDFDAAPGDQTEINAYLQGAGSVLGPARVGVYGGFWPLSRALNAKAAAWAWQTTAWSGGQWDPRAHIRQGLQVSVGGYGVDVDHAMKPDFGQWPRPAPPPPAEGPYPHTFTGESIGQAAAGRNEPVSDLLAHTAAAMSGADEAAWSAIVPAAGTKFYTVHP